MVKCLDTVAEKSNWLTSLEFIVLKALPISVHFIITYSNYQIYIKWVLFYSTFKIGKSKHREIIY